MRELHELLEELDAVVEGRAPYTLGEWLDGHLSLEHASAMLDRAPCVLDELARHAASPVGHFLWVVAGSVAAIPSSPSEEDEWRRQWGARHRAQLRATLLAGARPPSGWTPGAVERRLRSPVAWDRLWACSEVLRRELDDDPHRARVLELLRDPDDHVRAWAWLCAVRWAEACPDRVRDPVHRAMDGESLELRPRAVWAAWLTGSDRDLASMLSPCLDAPGAVADALQLAEWLGPACRALAPKIEALTHAGDEDLAAAATWALTATSPERWPRLLALASERVEYAPRRGARAGEPTLAPSRRASAAIEALADAADHLGDDAVAAILPLAGDPELVELIGALGPRARAATDALLAQLSSSSSSGRIHALYAALGRVGAAAELEAAVARDARAAPALRHLGAAADPILVRLLASPLPRETLLALVEVAGKLRPASPALVRAVTQQLDDDDAWVRLWACASLAVMPHDDALLSRVASVFVRCCVEHEPFYARAFHHAALALAPVLAERVGQTPELVAIRLLEALGWTSDYGEAHLDALRAIAEAPSRGLRVAARTAIERISDPPPPFRPNPE